MAKTIKEKTKQNETISDIYEIESFIDKTKKQNKALKKMLDNFKKKQHNKNNN